MDHPTSCWDIDVTVGEVNIALHGHALLTPELLDSFLTRITARATGADVARTRALHAMFAADQEAKPEPR